MKKLITFNNNQKGQSLITLMFFIIIASTIISASSIMLINNIKEASIDEQGINAYYLAESGIENALLRLLRNPSYTGETLTTGQGSILIEITPGATPVILSTGTFANSMRKIEAQTMYNEGMLEISTWKEIN